ncbi:LUD domain-containing protein, partial [Helicobacter japonicus]
MSHQEHTNIVHTKLNDKQLRKNLKSVMDTLKTNRKNLITSRYTDWEALREQGKAVKQKSLSQLNILLERFEQNATKNGFIVHWATDSKEVNEIIYKLMQEKRVNKI